MGLESRNHIITQNIVDILAPGGRGVEGDDKSLVLHLMARALHRAETNDLVIVGNETPKDYLDYLQQVTGESPTVLRANLPEGPLLTDHQMAPITNFDSLNKSDYVLAPYIQSRKIAELSLEIGIPMAWIESEKLAVEGSNLVEDANNKALFLRTMAELTGKPLPNQIITKSDDEAVDHLFKLKNSKGEVGVFAQGASAGGGVGNLDLRFEGENVVASKLKLNSSDTAEIEYKYREWLQKMRYLGSEDFIISPFVDLESSHTVSGFIGEDGEIIVYGLFEQTLHESTYDYQGFVWPATEVSNSDKVEMHRRALLWFNDLKRKGFVGHTDVDFAKGRYQDDTLILHSESNTREDAYAFSLTHVARINTWNKRNFNGINQQSSAIAAHDHVHIRQKNTKELVSAIKGYNIPLLGFDDNIDQGAVIMTPPRGGQSALAYIGTDPKEAKYYLTKMKQLLENNG